jgi:hypothetical protein
VRLEADDAGHVDDVVAYPRDANKPIEFVQVKFHVGTHTGHYSTETFIEPPPASKSAAKVGKASRAKTLLQKFWTSWQLLKHESRGVRLALVSNWSWKSDDPLASLISGRDDALPDEYFNAAPTTLIGAAREAWRGHLGADPTEFQAFMRCVRFRLGTGSIAALTQQVSERMADRCLHDDDAAVNRAVGQVGAWIREERDTITPELYQNALNELKLKLPDADPAIRICLHTIERQTYPESADYTLDWCERFLPVSPAQAFPRGSRVSDPAVWNSDFLPELQTLKAQLNAGSIRLLRVRGQARLSAWIAFGHVFERRAGYVIEFDQYGKLMSTDVSPTVGMRAVGGTETGIGRGRDLAVAIGISGGIERAVRAAIDDLSIPVDSLLVLEPSSGAGLTSISTGADLRAFVDDARRQISEHLGDRGGPRLHLFYAGPAAGGVFLGHALGAAAPEVQVYEFLRPGYAPSFLLRG